MLHFCTISGSKSLISLRLNASLIFNTSLSLSLTKLRASYIFSSVWYSGCPTNDTIAFAPKIVDLLYNSITALMALGYLIPKTSIKRASKTYNLSAAKEFHSCLFN